MTDLDPRLEHAKAIFLEIAYQASGRTCHTYTGLWADVCQRLGMKAVRDFADQLSAERGGPDA
jgi:hypothetical protein